MNREIKFRAWDIESKKMYQVKQIEWNYDLCVGEEPFMKGIYTTVFADEIIINGKAEYEQIEKDIIIKYDIENQIYPIMQYTGLKDKNGKEIYEGDIVRYLPYDNLGHLTEFKIDKVVWGEMGDSDGYSHSKHYEYIVGSDSLADIADSDYPEEAECEVIGNIYENPDLLNK